jgi:ribosomal protein S18 acetylase RimI-like enzyme
MPLRTATPADAPKLAQLYSLVWSQEVEALGEKMAQERAAKASEIRRWIKTDRYFLIETEGRLVAVLGCEASRGTFHLVHLVVHPDHRHHGYARKLMDHAEALARESGAAKIWFDTAPGLKAARQLYDSLGYTECGYLRKHYWGMDVVLYEKVF